MRIRASNDRLLEHVFGSQRYVLPPLVIVQLGIVFSIDHDAGPLPTVWPFAGRVNLDATRGCADNVSVDL